MPRESAHGFGSPPRLSGKRMAHRTPLPPLTGQARRPPGQQGSDATLPPPPSVGPRHPSPPALRNTTSSPAPGAPFTPRSAAVLRPKALSPRRGAAGAAARPRSPLPVSACRRLPGAGGTLLRKHEGIPKFPAQERRSPSPPTSQAFHAVPQKLCSTESRHSGPQPPALSRRRPAAGPQHPPAPRPFPGTHRGGEGTEAKGGAHGRFPHPLPPSSPAGTGSSLRRNGERLPAHQLRIPLRTPRPPPRRGARGPSAATISLSQSPPPARILPGYYFCFLCPFKS